MFRLVNVDGRAALEQDGSWFDLATVSGDDTLADPMVAVARHHELHDLAGRLGAAVPGGAMASTTLGAPVPRPRQVFGIGLNYAEHAGESGQPVPTVPLTFTKFPSCIVGPTADVPVTGPMVDWEVEVVAVIGSEVSHVAVADGWNYVAGLMLGQDVSDRAVQLSDTPPQFSLGKSFTAFGPTGPALVSLDAFADTDNVGLWCDVNGERMQDGRTNDLIFSVPQLVAYLSSICTLYPGDLVFTGTPSGVGLARGQFLAVGDELVSGGEGLGELRNRLVEGPGPLTF
jgi:2-keto-4-pentenoate hydratase/2-oxohepta-3-ene-1,7-dioic acid hydratase in catechol pathway